MFNDPSGEEFITVIGIIIAAAIIGAAAIYGDWEGASNASNTPKKSPPTPGNQNNSEMASSISSGQSRDSGGGGSGGGRGGFEGATATIHSPVNSIPLPQASIANFTNISSGDSGVYGVSQVGNLQKSSICPDCPPKINLRNPDTDALVDGFVGWAKHVRRSDRETVYVSDMLELTRNSGSKLASRASGFVGFNNQAIRISDFRPYKGTKIQILTDQHYIKNDNPGSEAIDTYVPSKGLYGNNTYDIMIIGRRQYGNSGPRPVLRMLVKNKQIRDNIAKRIFRYYRGDDE